MEKHGGMEYAVLYLGWGEYMAISEAVCSSGGATSVLITRDSGGNRAECVREMRSRIDGLTADQRTGSLFDMAGGDA